jgi:hypothetical protein
MLNAALTRVTPGTAQTYEHLASKFAFRMEGDGAFEPAVMDQFSVEAPVLESLEDRRFRAFLKKENALQGAEAASRNAEEGHKQMQELATGTLGQGWQVKEFNAPGGGVPRVLSLEMRNDGSSQTVYIDRYGAQPKLSVSSEVSLNGWGVKQSLEADIKDGAVVDGSSYEGAYLTSYRG